MRVITVTGVAGVGKSTLVSRAVEVLGFSSGDYADLMLEVSGLTSKDDLQNLPWERRRAIYDLVEQLIERRFTDGDGRYHLFENHLSIVQDGKVVTFPLDDYRRYRMLGLVVVEGDPSAISKRRLKDGTRNRRGEPVDLIKTQQETNWTEALLVHQQLGVPLLRLDNPDGHLPVCELVAWIRGLISK